MKKDSESYVCLFEDCDTTEELYSSGKEWVNHMRTQHLMQWRCVAKSHPPIVFDNQLDFESHSRSEHKDRFSEDQLQFIAKASGRPVGPTFESCPFCGQDSGNLEDHVGHHLHYLALLSLPFPEDHEETAPSDSIHSSNSSSDLVVQSRSTMKDYRSHMVVPEFEDLPDNFSLRPMDLERGGPFYNLDDKTRFDTWSSVLRVTQQHIPPTEAEQSADPVLRHIAQFQNSKSVQQDFQLHDEARQRESHDHSPGPSGVEEGIDADYFPRSRHTINVTEREENQPQRKSPSPTIETEEIALQPPQGNTKKSASRFAGRECCSYFTLSI